MEYNQTSFDVWYQRQPEVLILVLIEYNQTNCPRALVGFKLS